MTRTLIIGATGNIGSKLVDKLQDSSEIEVIPTYRSNEARDDFTRRRLEPRFLDMADAESIKQAVESIDTLFLLKPYSIQMLIQSKRVLDAAKAAGVRHVVNLGAHGPDDTPWAIIGWHHMVERYTEALGLNYTHLRPNFFMDNLLRSVNSETSEIYHYVGDTPISWVSTEDIAACAAAAICDPTGHRNTTYSLAVETASMLEIAEMLEQVTGRPFQYVVVPRAVGLENMLKIGREQEFIEPWLDYMDAIKAGQVAGVDATFSDSPSGEQTTTLRQFIEQHWGT